MMKLNTVSFQRRRWIIASVFAAMPLGMLGCASNLGPTHASDAQRKLLAPTGELRVGVYLGSPTSLVRASGGEPRGLTVELGAALAKSLGVPHRLVEYPRLALVLEAMKAGAVDFTVTNATPARARDVDFSAPVVSLELGLIVPTTSSLASPDEMDRAGIKIGVAQGSTSQGVLTSRLKAAVVVPTATLQDAAKQLASGDITAFATNKAILFEMNDTTPNTKVLPGRWGTEHLAIAIPKGRDAAMPHVQGFAKQAADSGLVEAASTRAGLRGTLKP